MPTLFNHWTEIPSGFWVWRSFSPQEIASKGNGSILVDEDALDRLQALRDLVRKPLHLNSAYRDPFHNAKVGGSPLSMHKTGKAFDINLTGHDKQSLIAAAREVGFTGLGINYKTFLHVDTGRKRTW